MHCKELVVLVLVASIVSFGQVIIPAGVLTTSSVRLLIAKVLFWSHQAEEEVLSGVLG